jgi:hypothetical protein
VPRFRDSRLDLTGRTDLTKAQIRQVYRKGMDEADSDSESPQDL